MIIALTIEKGRVAVPIGSAAKIDSVTPPVQTPTIPTPAISPKGPEAKTNAEIEAWTIPPNARNFDPTGPSLRDQF